MSRVAYDLFAGAGGASCGLREAGYDVHAFERWDTAADSHDLNHDRPVVRCDLMEFDWAGWDTPDLLWASPPCQPFSAAGDQLGEDDDRDGVPGFLRAVGTLRPPVVLMENVKGLTFEKHAEYLDGYVMRTLRRFGYRARWRVLDCADYGVPQNRERLIVMARLDDGAIAWPLPTHTDGGGLFTEAWITMAAALGWGHTEQPSPVVMTARNRQTGADVLRGSSWRHDWWQNEMAAGRVLLDTHRGQEEDGTTQTRDPHRAPAPALTAKAGGQWTLRTGANSMVTGRTGSRAGDGDVQPYERDVDRPAPTLDTKIGAWTLDRPSTSISCDPRVAPPGHKGDGIAAPRQMDGAIRLTVEQAARLQDFPDGYVFTGTKTAQFTQIGNAVPPSLARVLALGVSCPT